MKSPYILSIQRTLREELAKSSLSQHEIAKQLGWTQAALVAFIDADDYPFESLYRLCRVLGLELQIQVTPPEPFTLSA